jgi:hypothetical protein
LYQDADVAIIRLRTLVDESADRLEPATVFVMGQIAERYRQNMEGLEAKVPAATARVRGKSWRSLRKAMERRPEKDAGSPAQC